MKTLTTQPLFNNYPQLKTQWISLMPEATPVGRLMELGEDIGHANLFIKREDQTAPGYGGNKVRNLEFLLGRARSLGFRHVSMVAPLGSNFVAAAASQAARVGMSSEFFHFVPTVNDQLQKHAQFTQSVGAQLHIRTGSVLPAIVKSSFGLGFRLGRNFVESEKTYRLPMGGSDVLGALGHVNAGLEVAAQIRSGEIPKMDHLIVGVGTCGTMAGLLVGLRMAGLTTKVVGVRCVDKIICNEYRIAALANQLAKKLRLNFRFKTSDICLKDYNLYDEPERASVFNYARPLVHAEELISRVFELEHITLDTTYTSKVIHFLKNWVKKDPFQTCKKKILYWHTFSPTAMNLHIESSKISDNGPDLAHIIA